jgi:hypothetical protein
MVALEHAGRDEADDILYRLVVRYAEEERMDQLQIPATDSTDAIIADVHRLIDLLGVDGAREKIDHLQYDPEARRRAGPMGVDDVVRSLLPLVNCHDTKWMWEGN